MIAHWDDVEGQRRDAGHIGGLWFDLGTAAQTRTIGLRRMQVDAGKFSTPAHVHAMEEEIFYILGGSGLLWQGGATAAVGAGDAIVHRILEDPHTLRAGDDGLDLLAFGERRDAGLCHLPRAGVSWADPVWVDAGGGLSPFKREAAVGPPDCPGPGPRPANVVAAADAEVGFGGLARLLGKSAGSDRTGLNLVKLPAGGTGAPPHCHSQEEELFLVLAGSGDLLLWPPGGESSLDNRSARAEIALARCACGSAASA